MGFLDIFKKKEIRREDKKREEKINREEVIESITDSEIDLNNRIENLIIYEVLNVAQNHEAFQKLKKSAEIAAVNIGEDHINLLPKYLFNKITKPEELVGKYERDEEWSMVLENSILMVIFSYKEKGVDILTQIAYGNTKLRLKAINLLIKLAVEGVQTDKIIDDVMSNIVNFSDDDKIIIFGFASQIKGNNKIIALIQHFYKEFLRGEDVECAYETLVHLINTAQRHTSGHLNFLKFIAMDSSKIDLRKVIDIRDGEKQFIDIVNINELTRIRATLTFYNINQEEQDINNKLIYWSENYMDEEIRNKIKIVIENK